MAAPLLGGLIGLVGGIPGFIIGFLLGYLLRNVFIQSVQDRRILDYFESPGLQEFYEGENGLAAWCALAVLIASKNVPPIQEGGALPGQSPEDILPRVIIGASLAFTGPGADPHLFEHFARLALSRMDRLNPDLLAESLAARRRSLGGVEKLCTALGGFASERQARELFREIRPILDPLGKEGDSGANGSKSPNQGTPPDPWIILGLPPGTPFSEVKAHYRRLAKQFHPDELGALDKDQRETASRAFIAIQEAYKEIKENR